MRPSSIPRVHCLPSIPLLDILPIPSRISLSSRTSPLNETQQLEAKNCENVHVTFHVTVHISRS
ncbi:hypothetical protein Hanom_Chr01g00050751 [Helianthus anomalus]